MPTNNSTNLMAWHGYPPTTTTDLVYYGPNPYRDNTAPFRVVDWYPQTNTIYFQPQEKSFKEKVQDLRKDIKQYEEALDELAGLFQDALELINRRRRPASTESTQDGMKT